MNREMNIVKGLAIIAMVLGHCKSSLVCNVYLYHMALFVFVSGYFYNDIYSSKPVALIKKRFKSLYIPFLKFNIVMLLFKVILLDNIMLNRGYGVGYSLFEGIKAMARFNSVDGLISAFWFLKNLFYINVIFVITSFIVMKLVKKHQEIVRGGLISFFFLVCFFLAIKGKFINGEISFFTRAFILNIFFYLGFLYKKYEDTKIKMLFAKPWLLVAAAAYIYFGGKYAYIDTFYFYFGNIYFFVASSLVGIYFNIYLAKIILKYVKKFNFVEYGGNNSLWILAYHFCAFKIAIFIKLKVFGLPNNLIWTFPTYVHLKYDWILDATFGVFIPLAMCYVFKKLLGMFKNKTSTISA